ncbi:conserved hypothetical protein [Altererythrobacter sp. B11]|nr:conserved hypothetical protein [Altererythrobacter sp. B11]
MAAGIAFMAMGGAPGSYLLVNGGALLLAAVFAAVRLRRAVPGGWPMAILLFAALFALPLLMEPATEPVRRWIALGPVTLHAGMLALPALLAAAQRQSGFAWPAATAFAALVALLQPDLASALALFGAAAAVLLRDRKPPAIIAGLVAAAGLAATWQQAGWLAPVRFVEQVLGDAWRREPAMAALLGAALLAAILQPLASFRQSGPALAFSGCVAGFALASLIGPYPAPLIGYGASAILGYGLAIRILAAKGSSR